MEDVTVGGTPRPEDGSPKWMPNASPRRLDLKEYPRTRLVVVSLVGLAIVSLLIALAKACGVLADTASMYMYMFFAEIPLMVYGIVGAVRLALHKRNAIFFCRTYTIASTLIWLCNAGAVFYEAFKGGHVTVAMFAIPILIALIYLFVLRMLFKSPEILSLFPVSFRHYGMVEVFAFVLTMVCFVCLPFAIMGLRFM